MKDWTKIDAKMIATECSQKHIQSVLEEAQRDVLMLTGMLRDLVDRPIRFTTTFEGGMVTNEGTFTHEQIHRAREVLARVIA